MGKTLLYRLFKIGRIPEKLRPILESEDMRVFDEGIAGRVVLRNFKAPGRRSTYRIEGFSGFLAITGRRVIAFVYSKPIVNVPLDDPRLNKIQVALANPERIELSFDASVFHDDWQGAITVRFKTSRARRFYDCLTDYCPHEDRSQPPDRHS
jgi:hypothetical protein